MNLTVYEFMEDHDNAELNEYDWHEQMREAVLEYNEINDTDYNPETAIRNYKLYFNTGRQ
jgi:hypothetical protein